MDYFFMKMESAPNVQAISVTLKSVMEPAIMAFRNRVAALCKAEVTTKDAAKGDREANGSIENAVMLLRGIIRTIKCHIESRTQEPLSGDSPVIPWLVEHAGCILDRCRKGRDGRTPFERMHGKKPTLARQITTDPRNRMNDRYQCGVWLGMRNNSAECFIVNADGVFRTRGIRRLQPQDRWDTQAVDSVIKVPRRMTDGKWTVDSGQTRSSSVPIPPLPFEGARIQRKRITKQDIDEFGATVGCPGCNAIKDNRRAQAHPDRCRTRIEDCLRTTPHGAERLDRRNEVINEALAEEVQRGEQRKKRSDSATAAVPETESAAPEPGENPTEPEAKPKRRLLMKSASSTASGSGQQKAEEGDPR